MTARVGSPPTSKYYPYAPPALPMPTVDTPPLRHPHPPPQQTIRHSRSHSEATSSGSPKSNGLRRAVSPERHAAGASGHNGGLARSKSISGMLLSEEEEGGEEDGHWEICKVCAGAGRRRRGLEEVEMERGNRKILDLEISNTSLMAINAALERSKRKQQSEIRELRRRLRDGEVDPTQVPFPPSEGSASEFDGDEEDSSGEKGEKEPNLTELMKEDEKFRTIVAVVEAMLRRGREAVESKGGGGTVGGGQGTKVLSPDLLEEQEAQRRVGGLWLPDLDIAGDSTEDLTMLPQPLARPVPAISLSRPSSRLSHFPDPDSVAPHAFGNSSAASTSEDGDGEDRPSMRRRGSLLFRDDLSDGEMDLLSSTSNTTAPLRKVLKPNGNGKDPISRSNTPVGRQQGAQPTKKRVSRSSSSPIVSRAPSPNPPHRSRPATPSSSLSVASATKKTTASKSFPTPSSTSRPSSPSKRATVPKGRPISKSISGASPVKRPMSPLKKAVAAESDGEDESDLVLVENASPIRPLSSASASQSNTNSMLHWAKSALERVA
ncbi:hypothetical protein BT69DRAFT_1286981 [Atractiella rhizophila]|nr:hypothetical protein BT69DRAFT_1286981 [Atractiella rhizophila]